MEPWIIVAVIVLALVGGGVYFYLRSRPKEEEPVFYFSCTKCKRRLKYRLRQAGHQGQCPQCKQSLTFPRPTVIPKK